MRACGRVLGQTVQIDVAKLADVDQLVDVAIWVQVNVLVDLVVVVRAVDAHLAWHRGHWVLNVLQEVLGYHVDVPAAKCGRSARSEMVRVHLGLHADVVGVARPLIRASHVVDPVRWSVLPVELTPVPRRVDRVVARVLSLNALRRGEEAAFPGSVAVRSLRSSEVLLARVGLVLLGRGEAVQGWRYLAPDVGLVVDGGRSTRFTAASVEGTGAHLWLAHLGIIDGHK